MCLSVIGIRAQNFFAFTIYLLNGAGSLLFAEVSPAHLWVSSSSGHTLWSQSLCWCSYLSCSILAHATANHLNEEQIASLYLVKMVTIPSKQRNLGVS